ncbi:HNH endonuclease signature motif containing protein [Celeribacter halophilus]|uniref:HNH endonuclease n=1 Tax=Celeribacter halophilus TaxID=576117 RepID=UPI0026E25C65|nr:HNH endonuclease signature motif containing protein [Celeribacter halophilus]MDO6722630.1 HNH endonuclease signature motif containing protein [Celeribacter halophilus]
MARRLICVVAGCEELAEPGGNRCSAHAEAHARKVAESKARVQRSDEAVKWHKLYGDPRWKRLRRAFLASHPLCADCAELGLVVAATEVDHIERHMGDLRKFLDWSNLQGLCKRCHSRKTAKEVFHGAK